MSPCCSKFSPETQIYQRTWSCCRAENFSSSENQKKRKIIFLGKTDILFLFFLSQLFFSLPALSVHSELPVPVWGWLFLCTGRYRCMFLVSCCGSTEMYPSITLFLGYSIPGLNCRLGKSKKKLSVTLNYWVGKWSVARVLPKKSVWELKTVTFPWSLSEV